MAQPPQKTGITRHLSRRLLPLAVGIGLSLAFAAPVIYWSVEQGNLQHHSTLYAEDLAAKFRDFAAEAPALWKYQTYKFITISEGFHPTLEVTGFRVLGEEGEPISGYEKGESIRHDGKLTFAQELRQTLGTAPILFNNRQVGTVEVSTSDINLLRTTALLFCLSATLGAGLAVLVYRFPVGVVRRTEEHLRSATEFARTVLESIDDAVSIVDVGDYRVLGCNAVFLEQVGLDEADVVGRPCYELTHRRSEPCSPPCDTCPLRETAATGKHSAAEHLHFLGSGETVYTEVATSPIFDEGGRVARVVHVSRDITERKRAEQRLAEQARELEQLALFDALTGLCNRRGFLTLAVQQLRLADRFGKRVHLLFADLDGMKRINDTLGHGAGDLALQETAELLREIFRESDILARLGGDEFAVLAMGGAQEESEAIAARFAKQLAVHNYRANRTFQLSVSLGVVLYDPASPCSIEDLLARGDALMYEQKRKKKRADSRPSPPHPG
jgi:diguanylate cyclase (GGDEF)-like protein/PAS domain S-box-containing protein